MSRVIAEASIRLRERHAMTQRQLAAFLEWPHSRIGSIESCQRMLKAGELLYVLDRLGEDPDRLFKELLWDQRMVNFLATVPLFGEKKSAARRRSTGRTAIQRKRLRLVPQPPRLRRRRRGPG